MEKNICTPTAHIAANARDIAKVVLMPGDPRRSEFIAKEYLTDAKLFNNVRGVCGYTGTWKGTRVSVMASGMGMPSIGIYSHELYNFFDVDCIIRTGSAGALQKNMGLGDIVFGMGACTDSAYANNFELGGTFAPICDFYLLERATRLARDRSASFHVGNILSTDIFYKDGRPQTDWSKMGVLAVEMEAAALYMNAARAGKAALAVCTISDSLITGEQMSAEQRERGFDEMIRLSLDLAKDYQERA